MKTLTNSSLAQFVTITISTVLILGLYYYKNYIGGLPYGDVNSYASIARSIVDGLGIYQNSYTPLGLAVTGVYPTMDFTQSLGLSLVEAGFFKLFGATNLSVVLVSMVGVGLLAGLSFIFCKKLCGDLRLAFLVFFLVILNPFILPYSTIGLTEPIFSLLLLLFLYHHFFGSRIVASFFVSGLIVGLCFFTRSTMLFYMPAVGYLIWTGAGKNKVLKMSLFLLGIFCIKMPLTIRGVYYSAFDNNYMSLPQQVLFDLHHNEFISKLRSLDSSAFDMSYTAFIKANFWELLSRFGQNFYSIFKQLFVKTWGLNIIFILLAWSSFRHPGSGEWKRFVRFGQIAFIVSWIAFAIAWPISHYFFPLVPIVAIIGFRSLLIWLGESKRLKADRLRRWAIVGFLFLAVTGLGVRMLGQSRVSTIYKWQYLAPFIEKAVPKGATIVTNAPDLVSWHGGSHRRALLYPQKLTDILTIEAKYTPVDAILLTDELAWLFSDNDEWAKIYAGGEMPLKNFKLADKYEDGISRAVLFIKRSDHANH